MNLVPVSKEPTAVRVLYELLKERTPEQSIAHRKMPTFEEHQAFVRSSPYQVWYLVQVDGQYVGSVYLTKQREIGIFIFRAHHGKGHAKRAIKAIRDRYGRVLANVNPLNSASKALFEGLGGKLIQVTYELAEPE